jgi:hypothetical protein
VKLVRALCGKNAELPIVKEGGTHNYQQALNG